MTAGCLCQQCTLVLSWACCCRVQQKPAALPAPAGRDAAPAPAAEVHPLTKEWLDAEEEVRSMHETACMLRVVLKMCPPDSHLISTAQLVN